MNRLLLAIKRYYIDLSAVFVVHKKSFFESFHFSEWNDKLQTALFTCFSFE